MLEATVGKTNLRLKLSSLSNRLFSPIAEVKNLLKLLVVGSSDSRVHCVYVLISMYNLHSRILHQCYRPVVFAQDSFNMCGIDNYQFTPYRDGNLNIFSPNSSLLYNKVAVTMY